MAMRSHYLCWPVIGIFFFVSCGHLASAMVGFDTSLQDCNDYLFHQSYWNCFANNGFQFAVLQAAQGGNGMTAKIAQCVQNAVDNGFYISLYGWFCPVCYGMEDGYSFAKKLIVDLKNIGLYPGQNYTYFYVDIEDCDPDDNCWLNYTTNQAYVKSVVRGLQDGGASVGLYASQYEWNKLFGSVQWSDPALANLPIWYPNWNGQEDLNGFYPFGGYVTPHMHQFADSCSVCYNVDQDYIDA